MAFAIVAVLTGCGSGSGGAGSDTASGPAGSVTPAGPPPEKVTLAQLDAAKMPVSGAPDWMAHDGRNVFVKTGSGSVAVIDPDKSAEVRRLGLGTTGLCQGIGAGGGAVWSCDPNPSGTTDDLMRVSPKSGKVERIAVGKRPDQGHLDSAAGRVWVITDAGLVGVNLTDGTPDPPIDLGVPGTDLTVIDERAYVVSRAAGAVVAVDLAGHACSGSPMSGTHVQSRPPARKCGLSLTLNSSHWTRMDSRRPHVSPLRANLAPWQWKAIASSLAAVSR